MKTYNVNATSLIIRFTDEEENVVEHEVIELPCPNYMGDTAENSENSTEEYVEDDNIRYKIELYANIYEGNVAIYNDDTNEEIEDFEIEELYDEELANENEEF